MRICPSVKAVATDVCRLLKWPLQLRCSTACLSIVLRVILLEACQNFVKIYIVIIKFCSHMISKPVGTECMYYEAKEYVPCQI